MEYILQYFYLKSRMSERNCKGRGDVAGIDKKHQLLYCTTVFFKVLYSKMKKYFYVLYLLMYYWYGKYYKSNTVQYYIAN